MPQPLLAVEGLSVRYGSRLALDGVSFSLGRGVTGLLGPNGAGKSSLLRCLATVLRPASGLIRIEGTDAVDPRHHREVRRSLGYLPQHPGFYPRYSVEAFVHHVALLKEIGDRAARRQEVDRVLTTVGLTERRTERIRSLSGGMRQRLALASAMIGAPTVLILDEPTVGLDPEQRLKFREFIAELGRNHAVILSTHQTDDVATLCARVQVLDQGRILFDGTPHGLCSVAQGAVWQSPARHPNAVAAWATGTGLYRNIGRPPDNAQLVQPTLDDGYLMLIESAGRAAAPALGVA